MQLHYREFGDAGQPPALILHGLFGASDNWVSQARQLESDFHVFALDARNHGRSAWTAHMDYPSMAQDLLDFMDEKTLQRAALVGHSMGGKAVMQAALMAPERVERLAVVDIAPRLYPRHHDDVLKALRELDLGSLKSRGEAESRLAEDIHDRAVAAFLIKNLYRGDQGFAWRMNLAAIESNYDHLMQVPGGGQAFAGETLFIKGGNSDYVTAADRAQIESLFPQARVKIVQNSGHWPHADKPVVFAKILGDFLRAGRAA